MDLKYAALTLALLLPLQAQAQVENADIEEITVSADPGETLNSVGSSIHLIDSGEFDGLVAWRQGDVINQTAAVYLSQTSLNDHLLAMRSPVLTGSGACGSYRIEEDGLAIRPSGFCNVNGLAEVALGLADRIQLIIGPQGGTLGANGNLGAIRVFSPRHREAQRTSLQVSGNSFDSLKTLAKWSSPNHVLGVTLDSVNGSRAASGVDAQRARWVFAPTYKGSGWRHTHRVSVINQNQETAGYVVGFESYDNEALARGNRNPEAYRDLQAVRWDLSLERRSGKYDLHLRPYARYSDMSFLMHFLPGTPVESNGHTSAGVRFDIESNSDTKRFQAGAWAEIADVSLSQIQNEPLSASRPQGVHYDFEVFSTEIGIRAGVDLDLSPRLSLLVDGSAISFDYSYDNLASNGPVLAPDAPANTRVQYSRPPDQDNSFSGIAFRTALVFAINEDWELVTALGHAFRPPQMQELYRLRRDSSVPAIDTETSREISAKVNYKRSSHTLGIEVFSGNRRDVIYRDSAATINSNGAFDFTGFGVSWEYRTDTLAAALSAYSEDHTYASATQLSFSESTTPGSQVDGAPDWRLSGSLSWFPRDGHSYQLFMEGVGGYPLEATNTHHYGGHLVLGLGGKHRLKANQSISWRINNLTDRTGATRADYSGFTGHRYFPLEPRSVTVALKLDWE